jgi:Kef-type K+ transport system membrane component KefB
VLDGIAPPSQLGLAVMALGVGVVCGIVFIWLTRSRPASEELVLFLLGGCAFAAGLALQWDFSPLFVSMVMGIVVANLSRARARIQLLLTRWEKPVYVTFLLLAGALLRLPSWIVLPLAVGYTLVRFVSKVGSAALLARSLGLPEGVPRSIGLGLIPQGGISIAMAVSATLVYSDLRLGDVDAEATLFAVIVIGVALSDLLGPAFTLRLLRRAGEIAPEVAAEAGLEQPASSADR